VLTPSARKDCDMKFDSFDVQGSRCRDSNHLKRRNEKLDLTGAERRAVRPR
jgi:hypothetical protein